MRVKTFILSPRLYTRLLKEGKARCSRCNGELKEGELIKATRSRYNSKHYHIDCFKAMYS